MTNLEKQRYDNLIGFAAKRGSKRTGVYIVTSKNDEYYDPHIPYLKSRYVKVKSLNDKIDSSKVYLTTRGASSSQN